MRGVLTHILNRTKSQFALTLSATCMDDYLLKLYIAGNTIRSVRAIANLRQLCKAALGDQCTIEIVDVLKQPELAEQQKIIATPTLVRQLPLPVRRVIGDLSDEDKVRIALDLPHGTRPD